MKYIVNGKIFPSMKYYRIYQKSDGLCHICGLKVFVGLPQATPVMDTHGKVHFVPKLLPHYGTLDHKKPKSKGGSRHVDNLLLAHYFCNSERGNISVEQMDRAKIKEKFLKKLSNLQIVLEL